MKSSTLKDAILLGLLITCLAVNSSNIKEPRYTYVEYIYTCSICGDDKAEGSLSKVDGIGYEECKACGDYTELGGRKND